MQKIIILDANAILRYILDDIKEQADAVQEILQNEEIIVKKFSTSFVWIA